MLLLMMLVLIISRILFLAFAYRVCICVCLSGVMSSLTLPSAYPSRSLIDRIDVEREDTGLQSVSKDSTGSAAPNHLLLLMPCTATRMATRSAGVHGNCPITPSAILPYAVDLAAIFLYCFFTVRDLRQQFFLPAVLPHCSFYRSIGAAAAAACHFNRLQQQQRQQQQNFSVTYCRSRHR